MKFILKKYSRQNAASGNGELAHFQHLSCQENYNKISGGTGGMAQRHYSGAKQRITGPIRDKEIQRSESDVSGSPLPVPAEHQL